MEELLITFFFPDNYCNIPLYTPPFLEGTFHWIVAVQVPMSSSDDEDVDECFATIVSFNLRDEKLKLVDVLRRDMVPQPFDNTILGLLRGSLCVMLPIVGMVLGICL